MATRLRRWRESRAIKAENIAVLLGISADDLRKIEAHGHVCEADRISLLALFDECITIGELLSAKEAGGDEAILRRMDTAFASTCLKWRTTA